MISKLRKESLRHHYIKPREEDKLALDEPQDIQGWQLISLRWTQWHRRRGKEKACRRTATAPFFVELWSSD